MKKVFAAFLAIFITAAICGGVTLTAFADNEKAKSSEARTADKEDLIGKWYEIYYDDTAYKFDEKGYVTITDSDETETGKYSVKNGLVTMKLTSNDKYVTKLRANGEKYYTRYMAAVAEDGFLLTCHINKTDNFKPYKAGQSVSEYFDELDSFPLYDPIYLSKEKPVKVNQKNVLGTWVHYSEQGPSICILEEKKSTAFNFEEMVDSLPCIYKNGKMTALEELPDGWSLDEESCTYLCRGKMFITGSYSTDVLEKYTPKTVTKNIFDGVNIIYQDGEQVGAAEFKNGKGKLYSYQDEAPASYSIRDGKVLLTLDGKTIQYSKYYIIEYNDSEYGKITYVYLLKNGKITAVINVEKA